MNKTLGDAQFWGAPGFNPGAINYFSLQDQKLEWADPHFAVPNENGWHLVYGKPIPGLPNGWDPKKQAFVYHYDYDSCNIVVSFYPQNNDLIYDFYDVDRRYITTRKINITRDADKLIVQPVPTSYPPQYFTRVIPNPNHDPYDTNPSNETKDTSSHNETNDTNPNNRTYNINDYIGILKLNEQETEYVHGMLDIIHEYMLHQFERDSHQVAGLQNYNLQPNGMSPENEVRFLMQAADKPLWQLKLIVFFIKIHLTLYIHLLPRRWDFNEISTFYRNYLQSKEAKEFHTTLFGIYLHDTMQETFIQIERYYNIY